jgi:hypothetical protein
LEQAPPQRPLRVRAARRRLVTGSCVLRETILKGADCVRRLSLYPLSLSLSCAAAIAQSTRLLLNSDLVAYCDALVA